MKVAAPSTVFFLSSSRSARCSRRQIRRRSDSGAPLVALKLKSAKVLSGKSMHHSVPEAAKLLGVTEELVYSWIRNEGLPATLYSGRYHT